MNREIKFRAQFISSNKWLYGDLRHFQGNVLICEYDGSGGEQVKPETVGQFTGLLDNNGKEVFEGDIVEVTCLFAPQYGRKMRCSIVYEGEFACFCFKASDRIRSILSTISDAKIEVIGNIHENQELMKEDRK